MALFPIPSADSLAAAGKNLRDMVTHGRLADLRRMPSQVVDDTPLRVVLRYLPSGTTRLTGPPVLLVPPLAAPAFAFDLRRGGSLVEHLVGSGRRVYLVDYGPIRVEDGELGIEFWVDDVLPNAIRAVAEDAGDDVHIAAWCLGGLMALLTTASFPELPVRTVTAVASPFDIREVPLVAPFRTLASLAGGLPTAAANLMSAVPAPLVAWAFQLTGFDKYVLKPFTIASKLDDRDFLEQVEAVDHLMQNMYSYPGRLFGQLYHQLFRANDLSHGHLDIDGRRVLLADVKVPTLLIGGTDDVIVPVGAVRRGADLLTGSPQVRFETAPGGHLGVLAGRKARTTTWQYLDAFLASNDAA